MEYWAVDHRLNDLTDSERKTKILQILRRLSLSGAKRDFEYFAAFTTDQSTSPGPSVSFVYFSSFSEARDWWVGLADNSFRLANGNRLSERISGTRQELFSALNRIQ
jgi:hypothetical protein